MLQRGRKWSGMERSGGRWCNLASGAGLDSPMVDLSKFNNCWLEWIAANCAKLVARRENWFELNSAADQSLTQIVAETTTIASQLVNC